ncbi:MAG: 4-phosphoerythronate dehydrogenase [Rikenellaceae bacterium]|jgi:erythronate-4-phosphate dehydrogenase|nr:4-phosphoerythronate dehydrogenase [Rikenellaceae bacterium]
MKKVIVIDRDIPYLEGVFEPWFEVRCRPAGEITREVVHDASALLIRTRTRCDRRLLAGSRMEFIATATIGFDHIDRAYCTHIGVEWSSAAGSNARAVMQYVAATLVWLSRKQGWAPGGRTLGVVGVGHVGSIIVELARGLGFRVVCCDPPRMRAEQGLDFLPFDELLAMADIVTFHVPLQREGIDKTFHLADAAFFEKIRPGTAIINTSRGEVIENTAFSRAVDSGKISAAILDVWENEPIIDRCLLEKVALATPHIAGYSVQGKANASAMAVQALATHFGLPLAEWYPLGAAPQTDGLPISWETLCATIGRYYDIAADDRALRSDPAAFEYLRNGYRLREEYF